jgi:hypothetical protein
VTREGHGLFALAGSVAGVPDGVLVSLSELAVHGIVGSADVLPMPVGPELQPLSLSHEEEIRSLDLLSIMSDRVAPTISGHLAALLGEIDRLRAQRDRRRERLVALQNDALNMRGSLSPNGEERKVPFPLGETLTPAVDWLIVRVAELETGYVAPSPSCTRCYGADAARFVAQGGASAACPVCEPSEIEQLRARIAELEAERHSTNEALDDAVQALRERDEQVRLLHTERGDVAQLIERERGEGEECVDIDDLTAALGLGSDEFAEAGEVR